MSFREFVQELPDERHHLVLLDRTQPVQVQELLEATFPGKSVTVSEANTADETGAESKPAESGLADPDAIEQVPVDATEVVVLLEDDEIVASSPLSELTEQLLFVNSDLYITGSRPLEDVELPDVLRALDDVPFRLRGYPQSDREKLVLIAISRFVERRAFEVGAGTIRSSFQRLSRIEDERGTATVYERLAATDLDVHVYGIPDELPDPDRYDVLHAGRTEPFRRAWFVVHRSSASRVGRPPEQGESTTALVAYEEEPQVWSGFWTFDEDRIERIERYIERTM